MGLSPVGSAPGPKMVTIKFAVDTANNVVQARVIDDKTGQVVREIPSDQQMQVKESVEHLIDELV